MGQNAEHVVEVLRIILLACKSDMAIDDLVKHFHEWEGTNFPFQEFGCDSFVDFLRRCYHFVLKSTNDGLMVSLKQTANPKHVNDFIKEQNLSPLEIIYENDRAWRYGIQSISKQIQPRGHRRAPARIQCGPLLQIIRSKNFSNNRIDNVSVGPPRLSTFSQALMRAMETEPTDSEPEPKPPPQVCIHSNI